MGPIRRRSVIYRRILCLTFTLLTLLNLVMPVKASSSRYYIDHLQYADSIPQTQRELNTEILDAAYRYMEKTSYFPNIDAGAMYLVAATSQENSGSGDENIFANIRITAEVYEKYPNALQGYSTQTQYGLQSYSGYHVGPLSLSPSFLNSGSIEDELGVIGVDTPRKDITGTIGDRANWYDTCNMAADVLDGIWLEYFQHNEYRRGFDKTNKYAVVALTAMAMHQGSSLLTQDDNFMPTGQAENATPQFWFDWCNLMSQEKYIDCIRLKVRELHPMSYGNSREVNEEIVIPLMNSLKAEAIRMRPDFFSNSRYQARSNWVSGDTSYRAYVGAASEKTSAALKVLVSYIIMEERYQGAW